MKLICSVALFLSIAASALAQDVENLRKAAPANAVHVMFGCSVVDKTTKDYVVSPYISLSTYGDIVGRDVKPSISFRLGDPNCPIYCNGELYDPKDSVWWVDGEESNSTHEFLRWYAYVGACKVVPAAGGGYSFVSLEGRERDATYLAAGCATPQDQSILANTYGHKLKTISEVRKQWQAEGTAKSRPVGRPVQQPLQYQAPKVLVPSPCPNGRCPISQAPPVRELNWAALDEKRVLYTNAVAWAAFDERKKPLQAPPVLDFSPLSGDRLASK